MRKFKKLLPWMRISSGRALILYVFFLFKMYFHILLNCLNGKNDEFSKKVPLWKCGEGVWWGYATGQTSNPPPSPQGKNEKLHFFLNLPQNFQLQFFISILTYFIHLICYTSAGQISRNVDKSRRFFFRLDSFSCKGVVPPPASWVSEASIVNYSTM